MSFRLGLPLAVGALLVAWAGSAEAFCRTTTVSLPANYNPASRGCFTDGLLLYWRNQCVGFSINREGSRSIAVADAQRIIDTAFATWMSSPCASTGRPAGISISDLGQAACSEVRYNPETPNQNLIVFRDDGWPYHDPNNTLGLTTVTFNADTGEIFDADMEINSSAHNLSITDQVPANGFDLASVVTHEAGHFLGLAHATASTSTMFASYKPGTTALRTLSPDDVAGLCAIYPDKAMRVVSTTTTQLSSSLPSAPCDPTPRHGLTSVCYTPPPVQEKCGVGRGGASSSWGALAICGVAVAFGVRRTRARRSPYARA